MKENQLRFSAVQGDLICDFLRFEILECVFFMCVDLLLGPRKKGFELDSILNYCIMFLFEK